MTRIVSIEGNIGSGKTTLLHRLKEHYKNNSHIVFLREPVDDWESIKNSEGESMLQLFYRDQTKYSFSFQIMAYISRLSILRSAIKENPDALIITERCLFTDYHVFAKMLHDQNKIEDVNYAIYLKWFNEFANDYPVNRVIYVNTSPSTCYERIHKRARTGEEIIPLSYLEECDRYHKEYLEHTNDDMSEYQLVPISQSFGVNSQTEKLTLNGNKDVIENPEIMTEWIEEVDKMFSCL